MRFLALVLLLDAAAESVVLRTFDNDKIGAAPAGFVVAAGREAKAEGWSVQREGAGRVLSHAGAPGPAGGFSVAVYADAQFQDAELSVRLKATGGARSAGLVWKYKDPLNHYAVHLDLARQELALYRVVGGNRVRLEREDDLELDPDAWHTLRLVQEDGSIRVYLGGIRVFGERDRSVREPGGVGLWTSGDTTVLFDDFRVSIEQAAAPATRGVK